MLHPATLKQFEDLKRRHPNAELLELPSGACLVTLPGFALPTGWNQPETCVRFIVPVGYPGPFPDCFWASSGLRLENGQMPQASGEPNQIPDTTLTGLWFSWHVVDQHVNWNPNRDDLSTYAAVIAERFRRLQ